MIKTHLYKMCLYFKTSFPILMLGFVLAPLLIGFGYGILYEKMLDPNFELSPVTVVLDDENPQSLITLSRLYLETGRQAHANLQLKHIEEAQLSDYLNSERGNIYIEQKGTELLIHEGQNTSLEKTLIVNGLKNLMDNMPLESIQNASETELKALLDTQLNLMDNTGIYMTNADLQPSLGSKARMLTSVMTSMSLFIAFAFTTRYLLERESKMTARLLVANMSASQIFALELLSTFLLGFVLLSIQSLIQFGLLLSDPGQLPKILLLNVFQSAVLTGLFAAFIGLFDSEKKFKSIITPLLMVVMLLGGGFFPIEPSGVIGLLAQLTPTFNLYKIYEAAQLSLPLTKVAMPYLTLIGWTAAMLLIGKMTFKIKEQ